MNVYVLVSCAKSFQLGKLQGFVNFGNLDGSQICQYLSLDSFSDVFVYTLIICFLYTFNYVDFLTLSTFSVPYSFYLYICHLASLIIIIHVLLLHSISFLHYLFYISFSLSIYFIHIIFLLFLLYI